MPALAPLVRLSVEATSVGVVVELENVLGADAVLLLTLLLTVLCTALDPTSLTQLLTILTGFVALGVGLVEVTATVPVTAMLALVGATRLEQLMHPDSTTAD